MRIITEIDIEDLADQLIQYASRDEVKTLIIKLDLAMQDWGFTEDIFGHFKKEMKKKKKEDKEINKRNSP